ncbi:general secretion pathway protein GspM [Geobacter sp.]|uniref:general secretion pathway protein GspM n=1 Tax=Geobacter sp. TaxID=46610 RepID=UPI00261C341A|nr:general secretion pathway protein GspM [Geobacter sp.]
MNPFDRIRTAYVTLSPRTRLRAGYGVIILLAAAIACSAVADRVAALERKRRQREGDLVEMMSLKGRLLEARALSQRFTNRLAATRGDDTPAKIVEETGIKGKSLRITPVKGEERPGFVEDAAEVKIEGVSANEAVNLLYRLEKGPRPVIVRKALLKTRFDDPSRLDLTLTVVLLKAAPGGR